MRIIEFAIGIVPAIILGVILSIIAGFYFIGIGLVYCYENWRKGNSQTFSK